LAVFGFAEAWSCPRPWPLSGLLPPLRPSTLLPYTMLFRSLHMIRPVKPRPIPPTTAFCTPIMPPAAFVGCVPLPAPVVRPGTNPAMGRCCHHRLDSSAAAGAAPATVALYLLKMTPSPLPLA